MCMYVYVCVCIHTHTHQCVHTKSIPLLKFASVGKYELNYLPRVCRIFLVLNSAGKRVDCLVVLSLCDNIFSVHLHCFCNSCDERSVAETFMLYVALTVSCKNNNAYNSDRVSNDSFGTDLFALIARKITKPVLFENTNSCLCLHLILVRCTKELAEGEKKIIGCFMRDSATAHTANFSVSVLQTVLGERLTAVGMWLHIYSYFNLCDCYLWQTVHIHCKN